MTSAAIPSQCGESLGPTNINNGHHQEAGVLGRGLREGT